jgi:peptidyl-prolyl cis-trans isomerase SurA
MFRPAFSRPLLALSLVLALAAATPALAEPRVGIAATVNDDVITLSDMDNRAKLYLGGQPGRPSPQQMAALQRDVLNRLIDEKLQLQEAKALGVEVADEQIAQGFAEIARQNKTTPEEFRDRLNRAGVGLDTLREQIRAEIAWSMVVRRKLRPQVNVSEQEIETTLQQRATRDGQPQYHVAEIFLATDGANDERIAAEAAAIYEALKKGARFSEIARARSQNPGAGNGGDIGWLLESQLVEELRGPVSQMQPGQVTPPVKAKNGYYLVFLRDRRAGGAGAATAAAAPAPAQPPAEAMLTMRQLTIPATPDEPPAVVAAKFARAEALAGEVNGCAALETAAREFKTEAVAGQQRMSNMPIQITRVLKDLADGRLSAPVRTANGVSVFMICSRETPPAPAVAAAAPVSMPAPGTSSEEQTREAIASEIGSERLAQMQERYLRDLRATAFIERRI